MTLSCFEKISLVILAILGLRLLLRASILAWRKAIAPSLGLGIDPRTQGRWAVVTGATSGIGKAYAERLAEIGLDVLLVGRSLPALEEVSSDIKQRFGVETRIVEADLSGGQTVYAKIAKAAEGLEIAILVNNAGASYEYPKHFTEVSEDDLSTMLLLNVSAVTGITRALIPGMLERKKGIVVNIASAMAVIPSPYLTVYAASKAYVVKFSADLAAETEKNGVTVQCFIPGPVATKMSKIKKATWMAPTPEKFVEASLKTLGIERCTTGYLPHTLMKTFMQAFTCTCEKGAIWLVTKTMMNIRSRAIRKAEEKLQRSK